MSKSELITLLAQVPDNDAARLDRVAAALDNNNEPARPGSLRLYRMRDAVKETGLSRVTLWRAIKEGRIRSVEIRRGSHRIPEAELRRLVGAAE